MLFVVIVCQKSYQISATVSGLLFVFVLLRLIAWSNAAKDTSLDHKRVSSCDSVHNSSSSKNGTIKSPSYSVGSGAPNCRFQFNGSGKERVQISFTEFNLPSPGGAQDCDDAVDTLQAYVPIRGKYERIEMLCGEMVPQPIMSNGPRMQLEFRGRLGNGPTGLNGYGGGGGGQKGNRGFRATYAFLENFGIFTGRQSNDHPCTFYFNHTDAMNGWFHSPNFPGAYPRDIECHYYFYGGTFDKVSIHFTYFDVEGIYPCDSWSASDYVEFSNFMSIDRKYGRYCGKVENTAVTSDGKFFRVTFRSNDRLDGTGFSATYNFVTSTPTTETAAIEISSNRGGHCRLCHTIGIAFVMILFRLWHNTEFS